MLPEDGAPQLILAATGSEVQLCVKAAVTLKANGINTRVVSFPCFERFDEQTQEYGNFDINFRNLSTISISQQAHGRLRARRRSRQRREHSGQ